MVTYDRIQCKSPMIYDASLPGVIPYPEIVFINIKNKEKHNALTPEILEQLAEKIGELGANRVAKYVVLYPGANPEKAVEPKNRVSRVLNTFMSKIFPSVESLQSEGSFSAGADVQFMASQTANSAYEFARRGQKAIERIEKSTLTTIAAIDGYCIGGGNELATACDYRISTPNAKFMMPEKRLGILPGWGGCSRLQQHLGPEQTLNLLAKGERRLQTKAQEAYDMGLIDYIVPEGRDVAQESFRLILNGSFNHMPSRSNKYHERSPNLPNNDEMEARAFESAYQNGTPEGMKAHLLLEAKRIKKN